jgi:hypothetical protein
MAGALPPLEVLCDATVKEVLALLAANSRASHAELTNALRRKLRSSLQQARLSGALHANSRATAAREFAREGDELADTLPGLGVTRFRRNP